MVAQAKVNAFWGTVSASQALGEKTAAKVFVLFCAVSVVSTSMASATATQAGRARSAVCAMMNVKYLIAMGMASAVMENVLVSMDSKANFVIKWIALTPTALGMVIVLQRDPVFANAAGRVLTAPSQTMMLFSVSLIAQDMEHLILKHKLALVSVCGRVMTVPKNYVTKTVDHMDIAWVIAVSVIWDGLENIVC